MPDNPLTEITPEMADVLLTELPDGAVAVKSKCEHKEPTEGCDYCLAAQIVAQGIRDERADAVQRAYLRYLLEMWVEPAEDWRVQANVVQMNFHGVGIIIVCKKCGQPKAAKRCIHCGVASDNPLTALACDDIGLCCVCRHALTDK